MTALGRTVRVLGVLVAAGIVATAAQVLRDPLGDAVSASWALYGSTLLCCVALCVLRAVARPDARAGWAFLGAGLAAIVCGGLYLSYGPRAPFPGPGDLMMLAYYPLTYVGLVLLVRDTARRVPAGVWLDGLTTGLALAAVTAAVVGAGPDRSGHSTAALVAGMAHPFGDMLLLAALGTVAVVAGARGGRRWLVLLAGVGLATIADAAYFAQTLGDGVIIPR